MQGSSWYKEAVFYAVDIGYFFDSDNDGYGDLEGLLAKLDYLKDLGVDCLWVLPFYPSEQRDNGYAITEYFNVASEMGTLDQFRRLCIEAKSRGIRILIDLVIHHTSNNHPWFQAARTNPKSPYRNYYVWVTDTPEDPQPEPMFPGVEDSVWQFDEIANAYYFHSFYHYQPDLNFANPKVQEEALRIAEFWMAFGIDGFRVDAANHLFEQKGLPGTEVKDPCAFLNKLHATITEYNPEGVLLAEADIPPEQASRYTCNDSGILLYFNFFLNNFIFLSLATEQSAPLIRSLHRLSSASFDGWWINFLRNLDELDLGQLTQKERDRVLGVFAPEETMRIYDRGIRRRLAPMMNGDLSRLKMVYGLLLSLPGSPMFPYGDEIGMGDDLHLPERESVRLPMQWAATPSDGFANHPPDSPAHHAIESGKYGFKQLNVAEEEQNENSLLSFMQQAIKLRREHPAMTHKQVKIARQSNEHVLSYSYGDEEDILVVINLSSQPQSCTLDSLEHEPQHILLANSLHYDSEKSAIHLEAYGFGWLSVEAKGEK